MHLIRSPNSSFCVDASSLSLGNDAYRNEAFAVLRLFHSHYGTVFFGVCRPSPTDIAGQVDFHAGVIVVQRTFKEQTAW